MIISILLIIIGFLLLIKGADYLVDGASVIAKKFHIPEIIIGLTVVSIGTSMPELFVSATSALQGHSDISIGNVIGSNICNLLLILGLSSVIRPVKFSRETRLIEIPMCLAFTVIFFAICNSGAIVTRVESFVLLFIFLLFIIYTIVMAKKGEKFDEEQDKSSSSIPSVSNSNTKIWINVLKIIGGILALKFGGDLSVDNAVKVAQVFNVSEKIIGLTILAVGTSLPELVTSVTAAIKGNSDIAIGNIIGSCIFNMLLIVGVASFISPISYNLSYNIDMYILIISTIILSFFPVIPPKNKMSRANGFVYLLIYAMYLVISFVN